MTNIHDDLKAAQDSITQLRQTSQFLTDYADQQSAQIAKWLRVGKSGLELDPDMISLTLTKPYTLIPISANEAWMIQWAGIKTPIFGYVVAKDGPFIKSRVSRSMDLITPFPQHIKDEMGWKAPEHKVVMDSSNTGVTLTDGDEQSFKKKYGQFLAVTKADPNGTYRIRGGDAWIQLVSSLIADGILPYAPKKIANEHWDSKAKMSALLIKILDKLNWKIDRPYIERAVQEWRECGAMLFNIPPGGGKSLIFYIILTHFKGKVLLLADTLPLVEKWIKALKEICPNANVTVSTYQGAQKYKDNDWDLILFDEAQRIPATTFSKIAFFKTHYRAGATGTAWREDKRQYLIVALCGKPFYIPWEELIAAGILKKPRITVAVVKNENEKLPFVKSLIAKRRGKVLIYCDWIDQGTQLANSLGVPFVNGSSKNKLDTIEESDICVVSKVADRGLSFQNLNIVIEVAFQGRSREQMGQRVGRLLHADFEGHFYTVFTPAELEAYKNRLLGVELELAGEVDIEYLYIGDVKEKPARESTPRVTKPQPNMKVVKTQKPTDAIGAILQSTPIARKLKEAELPGFKVGTSYLSRIMRFCWDLNISPNEIMDSLGIQGLTAVKTFKAGCKSLTKVSLLVEDREHRLTVNHEYIDRLVKLQNVLRTK